MPRFDIGPAAEFESRDGGLGTGGLVRNGFLEEDEGVWSWQRPALAPGEAAPFTGTALGMLVLGTTLYGIGHNGTASSYEIRIGGTSTFNLTSVQGTLTRGFLTWPVFGYGYSGGTITPNTVLGGTVASLYAHGVTFDGTTQYNGSSFVTLAGTFAQTFLNRVTVRRSGTQTPVTRFTSVASFSQGGGNTTWAWNEGTVGTSLVTGTGTLGGNFK